MWNMPIGEPPQKIKGSAPKVLTSTSGGVEKVLWFTI